MTSTPATPATAALTVPKPSVDRFLDQVKQSLREAAAKLAQGLADGELDADDVGDALVDLTSDHLEALTDVLDGVVQFDDPTAEALSDIVIEQGADLLRRQAEGPLRRAVRALDDLLGYNPARAARRFGALLEADLADGERGNDRVGRIRILGKKIARRSPELAAWFGIERVTGGITVEGVPFVRGGRTPEAP